jgi:hypothetical protein
MFDMTESYSCCNDSFASYPIVNPNIRTGEGRSKCRPLSRHKVGDQKKKAHRKMAKKSRRANR